MINDINLKNMISMTELQKLSLKKLRKMGTPLFVLDRKSKKGGFVIMDAEAFKKEFQHRDSDVISLKEVKKLPPYRGMALLWDRPDLSDEEFHALLKGQKGSEAERLWASKRLLEYAPSPVVKEILSLDELRFIISKVRLRSVFQEAWSHAIQYWSENP